MGGGEEEFILLSEHTDGLSSKMDQDAKWNARLERFREIENMNASIDLGLVSDSKICYSVPRIVVIGEESSGKSSTLERIAMMQFFPTDYKICTRMPIELRLRHKSADQINAMYASKGMPPHASYVHMSVKRAPDSKLVIDEQEWIFPPHEACGKIKQWMDSLTAQGKLNYICILYNDVLKCKNYS